MKISRGEPAWEGGAEKMSYEFRDVTQRLRTKCPESSLIDKGGGIWQGRVFEPALAQEGSDSW